MWISAKWTMAWLVVLSASGCMTQSAVDAYVTDLRPLPSTLLEQRAELKIRLKNISEAPLAARGIDVKLIVNGKQLARGVDGKSISIEPLSETVTSVAVSTRAFDVFRQLVGIQTRETYSYRLKGRLIMDGLDKRFDHGGEISRAELLKLFPAGARSTMN